ncbi:hypothetical protein AB1Y20_009340 [Prymnesium parvum]|uniref:Rhamnogalacturonase A/B/Epimerase-like pectate lyase domain-containing protein n=1 Tax=Prymnesium parvum TaxID=97485 RepID=A0AB34K032_PRYPA
MMARPVASGAPPPPRTAVNVRHFGARGDGRTDDTRAFQLAIASLPSTPSRLAVPCGPSGDCTYLIRPINLTSAMELYLEDGTTLRAIADARLWPLIPPLPSYGRGRERGGARYTSLLRGEGLHDVSIRGEGYGSVIDGQGAYWWLRHLAGVEEHTRGHLIEFASSRRVAVANLRMIDSPYWNTHFFDCDGVHVSGVRIEAPLLSPNTDGWDPDSSRDVLIEHSSYRGGDDCIAIKSGWDCFGAAYARPSANITARNVTCEGPRAGVAIGSEMSGGVANVSFESIRFISANGAAHIKTGASRGGYVTDVSFSDLTFADGAALAHGILVDAHYGSPNPSCPAGWRPAAPARLANFTFERIRGASTRVLGSAYRFHGSEASPIAGVVIRDAHFPASTLWSSWSCSQVSGTVSVDVEPKPPCSNFVEEVSSSR